MTGKSHLTSINPIIHIQLAQLLFDFQCLSLKVICLGYCLAHSKDISSLIYADSLYDFNVCMFRYPLFAAFAVHYGHFYNKFQAFAPTMICLQLVS